MNPDVPAAGLWWLLALMPEDFHRSFDVPHLMTLDYLNTDSWSILGIMEGRAEWAASTRCRTAARFRASCGLRQTRCIQAHLLSPILEVKVTTNHDTQRGGPLTGAPRLSASSTMYSRSTEGSQLFEEVYVSI